MKCVRIKMLKLLTRQERMPYVFDQTTLFNWVDGFERSLLERLPLRLLLETLPLILVGQSDGR